MPASRYLVAVNSLILALGLLGAALPSLPAAESGADSLSPAELRIEAARKVLQKQPNRVQAYNDLAMALIRRARETADTSYYQQAAEAVANSLRLQPDNFEAGQARVALRLAERRYREALEEARALNHRTPDGVLVWGYMAEAQAALGDYDAAAESAQWMMNLRPGNLPAYLCGAALREDWGDLEGALDFLSRALQQVPPLETEEFAWILTQMARINRLAGRPEAAEPLLQQALKTFPEYSLSLEELAEVRLVEQRYPEAVELLQRRNQKFPSLHSRYQEARALERAGKRAEAESVYADFERQARGRIEQPDNANLELVAYYAERAHKPEEALRIARREVELRHDVGTLDAYAWALYAHGETEEANRQIEKALAVGSRGPSLFYHAGVIEVAAGQKAAGARHLRQALDLDPASEVAEAARLRVTSDK
jgi:tetratricopeptide (TPR) repeat protein